MQSSQCVTVHPVPKFRSCHKAIMVITGRAHCYTFCIYIYNIYIYIYTKCITMCPPGYHHNGFMATPELGHRMYGYTL